MGKLETELARLDKEIAARRAGLYAAAGRIAEAEALANAINDKVGDDHYTSAAPCITSHGSGDCHVRVLVLSNHDRVRIAIQSLGLTISSEKNGHADENVTSTINLRDFSIEVDMYREPMALAEAA